MKETTNHKLRYPETKDPDTLALYWENLAKDTERELDAIDPKQITGGSAGKIIIAKSTGAGVYAALKGDATLAEDGTLSIGTKKIDRSKLADPVLQTGAVDTSEQANETNGTYEISWPVAFADTKYKVAFSVQKLVGEGAGTYNICVVSKSSSKIIVSFRNLTGAKVSARIEAIAVHD